MKLNSARHESSLPESLAQRFARAARVLWGCDDINDHPEAWAYRATWWAAGARSEEARAFYAAHGAGSAGRCSR